MSIKIVKMLYCDIADFYDVTRKELNYIDFLDKCSVDPQKEYAINTKVRIIIEIADDLLSK